MVDLDHFKSINDQWGHEAGNEALKTVAGVFRQQLRQSDIICRYGGEEFAILLPQTPLTIAVKVADRVRGKIEQTLVIFEDSEFSITASLGAGVYQQANEYTEDGFVDHVDQWLYQAKQQGRNQVCHVDFDSLKPRTAVSLEERAALFSRRKEDD
jgi:diguanylate cyclase (GGDEF)-like protein